MTVLTVRGGAVPVASITGCRTPNLGPHVYLLSRVDAHLALLSSLRRELGGARRPARPGSRLQAAAASALAAQHYAADIAHVLAMVLDTHHCPADNRPPRSE